MPKILTIDDDHDVRALLLKMLSKQNVHKIVEAEDGSIAKMKISNERFDLILLDLKLPKVGGEELVKFIRANKFNSQTPILIISGFLEKELIIHLIKIDRIDFLAKPMSSELLNKKIDEMLALED